MSETRTYTGGCQCGAVRYEVDLQLEGVAACNCSMCGRAGWLLAFTPRDNLRLLTDPAAMSDYQFGHHAIHHWFCKTCGIKSWAEGVGRDGKPMATVNVRCLDGVDATALPVQYFDGASL